MRRRCEVLVLVLVALLGACLAFAPAAEAASVFEVLDVGPAVVLGPGGSAYPADVTLKLFPIDYDEPIPTDTFLRMLEGVGKYTLANVGADILFRSLSLNTDEVDGGISLPVVNTRAIIPVRAGMCMVDGIGIRPFLRMDLLGGNETTAVTALIGTPLMLPDRSLGLGFGSDSVLMVYRAHYR